jgi:hypothetical protein
MQITAISFTGSRTLSNRFAPLVSRVIRLLAEEGISSFAVGCARGADALCVTELHRLGLVVKLFSVKDIRQDIPYVARLMLRSCACVDAGQAVVAFFGAADSRGTFKTCQYAVSCGKPVFAFACGSFALPSLGAGSWVHAVGVLGSLGARQWQINSEQLSLV